MPFKMAQCHDPSERKASSAHSEESMSIVASAGPPPLSPTNHPELERFFQYVIINPVQLLFGMQ